ncbi:transcription factor [Ganoderma sinense ZZ0214-1]|uniref:Transcription factor n=1 Tax=Ganoderma sinense ZZ0214-1 TaxID=1077348 RepID=A0A2G8STG5_9APHY|nr:transcription factor [Ganoderma sinense ZZ0214-1]
MNTNPPNLAFLQAMMTSMPVQAQPPLQGVSGPSSVAAHAIVPQQAAFPTFFLQAPQLQTLPGQLSLPPQFSGQPWVLPTFQTMTATQPSAAGFQSTPRTAPNVARVAVATKRGSITVGSAPDDERILVNSLRKAHAEGLTPLHGFGKLDQVNNHTTAAWKDYFLLHIERLGPKVYPQAYAKIPASSTNSQSQPDSRSTSTSGGPERRLGDESASAGSRTKRGPPLEEYHDGVYIPFLPPGVKPKAPRRDPRDNTHKFTREEKIFFIQFLKYRLRRGPVPNKEQLYRELAEQVPYHNADSWKRLWDKECRLPNEIYIQARKRVKSDLLAGSNSDSEGSRDESGHSGDEEEEDTDPEFEPATSQTPSSTAKKAKKGRYVRKYRVTEADIQAMAQFIVEKRKCDDGWMDLSPGLRWGEFAARPENRKRSLGAWQQIASRRPQGAVYDLTWPCRNADAKIVVIDAYVQQYEAEQAAPAEEEISDPSTEDISANSQLEGEEKKGAKPAAKRPLDDQEPPASEEIETPAEKRPRLENAAEVIVLD